MGPWWMPVLIGFSSTPKPVSRPDCHSRNFTTMEDLQNHYEMDDRSFVEATNKAPSILESVTIYVSLLRAKTNTAGTLTFTHKVHRGYHHSAQLNADFQIKVSEEVSLNLLKIAKDAVSVEAGLKVVAGYSFDYTESYDDTTTYTIAQGETGWIYQAQTDGRTIHGEDLHWSGAVFLTKNPIEQKIGRITNDDVYCPAFLRPHTIDIWDYWSHDQSEHTFHSGPNHPWPSETVNNPQFRVLDPTINGHAFADVWMVYNFWHKRHKEYTFHFQPAWDGEKLRDRQFYAYHEPTPGTFPVWDFWHEKHQEHTFHFEPAWDGEERRNVQFWAYPVVSRNSR